MKDTQWNKMTLIHGENIKKEKKKKKWYFKT